MPAIKVEGLSKRFILHHNRPHSFQEVIVNLFRGANSKEEFWALHDLWFEVEEGESLGIIGHNGSGKSTLLKLIAGIFEPTVGAVTINGRVSALIELGAGFHPDLTGRENIYLNGSLLGLSRREMDRKFPDIVDFAGLEHFIDTPLRHYSSGMYMRLGFSVAINVDADILLVDEVLAVGDISFQERCLEAMRRFQKEGKTIILVSHSLDLVKDFCQRGLLLSQGQQVAWGETIEVVNTMHVGIGHFNKI